MSWSISLAGHSNGAHNDAVKAAFEQAVRDLRKIPGNSVGSGGSGVSYTYDASGRVELRPEEVAAE